jgi:hypothetical protein
LIEYALEFFDPDYLTAAEPNGKLRHTIMRKEAAERSCLYQVPPGKRDYRVVQREVTEWVTSS